MARTKKYPLKPLAIGKETVGQRIAKFRKSKGYTQEELAAKIGITRNLVTDYEIGRLHLNDDMVVRFALTLEVSADTLLGLKEYTADKVKHSVRIMKRVIRIESLPEAQQKFILKAIDSLIAQEELKQKKNE